MPVSIEIRPYSVHDQAKVLALLRVSLGEKSAQPRNEAWWRWKHEQSPFGESLRLCAWAGENLVGVRAFMPWRFASQNGDITVARAVDTATHPKHQGKGIFRALTMAAVDEAQQRGWHLVMNTPNGNSLPGYLKMGWQQGEPLKLYLSPVRPIRMLRRFLGGKQAARLPANLPGQSAVEWLSSQRFLPPADKPALRPQTVISKQYFQWRYCDCPHHFYRVIESTNAGKKMVAVYRCNTRRGAVEAIICELIGVQTSDDLRRLLKPLRQHGGVDFLLAHFGPGRAFASRSMLAGFITGGPLTMNFTTRALVGDNADFVSPINWRLSLGDIELF